MVHKINRAVILITIFFTLVVINFALITYFYKTDLHRKAQEKVLQEIEMVLGPPTNQFAMSAAPLVLGAVETQVGVADGRAENLRTFFNKYNSPLVDYVDHIIKVSDQNGFYYGLIPAISMAESGGCRVIPENSYNCYGLGIYGNKVWRFASYEEGIDAMARVLKKNYIDAGLHTPSDIMAKYTPSSAGSWANAVRFFIGKLEQ